jgi:UDP-3-O-[3-hydroxymyristoyl] N-acetylglucosamine deacetylase/3-hydroxyacyl-[acyl-carrier-protein] dehydratase
MIEYQHTLKSSVSVRGTGLHTGQHGTITFVPAPPNHGIKFKRIDLPGNPIVEALVENVIDTARGTTLGKNGATIYTMEHALAALTGLGIDNVLIELDVEEIPILDGSSKQFVEAFEKVGSVAQDTIRNYYVIEKEIFFEDKEKGIEMKIVPCETYKIDVKIDYGTEVLNIQFAELHNLADFKKEISPCRTFVFLHELEFLLKNNLVKGGDLSNAIVFVNRKVSQEELDRLAELFHKPKVKVKDEGILNNLDLHFENEPARHKLLDVLGDLTLIGMPIKGHITAYRPGHYANTELAKLIKQQIIKAVL